ncbi:hypothetical protein [Alteribacillus bidgolensis]|uniref:Uncharacterized protein n=1 Tax=Alteribacillus bidgolensis TaxID=930129 RepID=A0A1G8K3X1_9BACI|nr:hypothetical protein [Alteribacillus bidgolensis]SDI38049.1 hypothetical protein SAMN05216352_10754 [Alteribacillus bidgolensis]
MSKARFKLNSFEYGESFGVQKVTICGTLFLSESIKTRIYEVYQLRDFNNKISSSDPRTLTFNEVEKLSNKYYIDKIS